MKEKYALKGDTNDLKFQQNVARDVKQKNSTWNSIHTQRIQPNILE